MLKNTVVGALGQAGQRCTSLRRLIAHESVKEEIVARLKAAYSKIRIGHPLEGNLVGPLIDKNNYGFGTLVNANGAKIYVDRLADLPASTARRSGSSPRICGSTS